MTTTIRSSRATQFAIAMSVILLLMAGERMLKAFNPQPDPPGFWGMIGITPSDTMRLNIVNLELGGVPPDPCKITLRFLDPSGTILKQQTVTVKPTQSAFLDLTGLEAGGGFRTEVHPVMLVPSNAGVGCSAAGSVEVFNTNSGETTLIAQPVYIPVQQTATTP